MPFHFSALFNKSSKHSAKAGFSMIELLVSIGIIVLVLTITLTRQDSFNSAVLLRSEAFEVALAIRETQLSAVSAVSDGGGEFRSTMGVYFSTNSSTQYNLFRDGDNNNYYSDASELFGSPGLIDPRFSISRIVNVGGAGEIDEVSVVFRRPNFDALFYQETGNELTDGSVRIRISITNSPGTTCGEHYREIEITRAGQITVLNCP